MRKTVLINGISILGLTFLFSCSSVPIVPLYELPPDWKNPADREKTIAEYSKYLKGEKIFLDPGHGGEDRKNKSRDGKIIEADVNLNVALHLKKYLEEAGAVVYMSREVDKTVPLAYRSELANNSGAGIFISIHHNAPAKDEDNYSDYTAVYYHAKESNYEYEPCNQDIARYIERDLSYVMHNPIGLGSFDGTYSDYNIYPGEGFSVLRKSNIPAVLAECAFHTSRFEELRLNDDQFNRIQAWGIFRGLAKYLKAGKPEIVFLPDSLKMENGRLKLSFLLKDSAGINPKGTRVFFNKLEKDFSYDPKENIVSTVIDSVKDGSYNIRIIAANKNGNHSFPYRKLIEVSDSLKVSLKD